MTPSSGADLACFGYLAYAQVTTVASYPTAKSGAEVTRTIPSLAADAALTALTARRLGSRVRLVNNRVGPDPAGRAVLDAFDAAGVTHQAVPDPVPVPAAAGAGTSQLTIVTDDAGTRTWFARLGDAIDHLTTVDLSPLGDTRLTYIDCYRIIDSQAVAAITASRFVNSCNTPHSPVNITPPARAINQLADQLLSSPSIPRPSRASSTPDTISLVTVTSIPESCTVIITVPPGAIQSIAGASGSRVETNTRERSRRAPADSQNGAGRCRGAIASEADS